MLVWCLGMYASASTWAFNAARGVLRAARPGETVTGRFVANAADLGRMERDGAASLVKSHEIADEAAAWDLAGRSSRILVTLREPRDAVASLMRAHGYGFDDALRHVAASAALCRGFARDRRALTLRYEDGFFDDTGTVPRIAGHLGVALEERDAAGIADGLRRAAVEAFIATLPARPGTLRDAASGDLMDPETQWHSHHAGRTGAAGRWRQALTAAQAASVAAAVPYGGG